MARGLRGHRSIVTAALYHGLALAGRRNRIGAILMTVDDRVRRILETLGLYTAALPGAIPGPFCGSPSSIVAYAHFAPMLDHQRRVNPEAYKGVTLGGSLVGVDVPPVEHFDLLERALLAPSRVEPIGAELVGAGRSAVEPA